MEESRQPTQLERLRKELAAVRSASLEASRTGDYMKVARLTASAHRINKVIWDFENGVAEDT
jgi:kynureninase